MEGMLCFVRGIWSYSVTMEKAKMRARREVEKRVHCN